MKQSCADISHVVCATAKSTMRGVLAGGESGTHHAKINGGKTLLSVSPPLRRNRVSLFPTWRFQWQERLRNAQVCQRQLLCLVPKASA